MDIEGQRAPNTAFKIKLLFATAYLTNHTPHSALIMGALYGRHGKEATLQHLRTVPGHLKTSECAPKKLKDRWCKNMLCEYS